MLDDDAGEDEIVEEYNHKNYADLVGPPSKGAQQSTGHPSKEQKYKDFFLVIGIP